MHTLIADRAGAGAKDGTDAGVSPADGGTPRPGTTPFATGGTEEEEGTGAGANEAPGVGPCTEGWAE